MFSRYIDSLGYIYRKKLPIYLNKKGNHVVYYPCSKCNLMQNFIFELKTFKVKEDKVHTCNLTDHLPNKKDSTMNQLDQKEVEELLRLVIFLKYLFFYYLLQGFNANCQTSLWSFVPKKNLFLAKLSWIQTHVSRFKNKNVSFAINREFFRNFRMENRLIFYYQFFLLFFI